MNHDSLDYGYLLLRTNFWEIEWQDIPILKKSKIRCLWNISALYKIQDYFQKPGEKQSILKSKMVPEK